MRQDMCELQNPLLFDDNGINTKKKTVVFIYIMRINLFRLV